MSFNSSVDPMARIPLCGSNYNEGPSIFSEAGNEIPEAAGQTQRGCVLQAVESLSDTAFLECHWPVIAGCCVSTLSYLRSIATSVPPRKASEARRLGFATSARAGRSRQLLYESQDAQLPIHSPIGPTHILVVQLVG